MSAILWTLFMDLCQIVGFMMVVLFAAAIIRGIASGWQAWRKIQRRARREQRRRRHELDLNSAPTFEPGAKRQPFAWHPDGEGGYVAGPLHGQDFKQN